MLDRIQRTPSLNACPLDVVSSCPALARCESRLPMVNCDRWMACPDSVAGSDKITHNLPLKLNHIIALEMSSITLQP